MLDTKTHENAASSPGNATHTQERTKSAKELARIPATLIPGDGIGPEITDAVVDILAALGAPFDWDRREGGMGAVASDGDPLPPALLESVERTRLALKGPLTTPVGGGFRSVNVRLREAFGLYANLRPVRTMVPVGAAIFDGKLFRGTLDGNVIAIDIKTGKEVWRTKSSDPKDGYSITGAPIIANGVLMTGVRRGIRPSWLSRRLRPGDRQAIVAHLHDSRGGRARIRDLAGRFRPAWRRQHMDHRIVRS
jgi:hypothetical protein